MGKKKKSKNKKYLRKGNLKNIIQEVLSCGFHNMPLDDFLMDNNIRNSEWQSFVNKHKDLQIALDDAQHFFRKHQLDEVRKLMKDKFVNPTVVRLYMKFAYGMDEKVVEKKPEEKRPINLNILGHKK